MRRGKTIEAADSRRISHNNLFLIFRSNLRGSRSSVGLLSERLELELRLRLDDCSCRFFDGSLHLEGFGRLLPVSTVGEWQTISKNVAASKSKTYAGRGEGETLSRFCFCFFLGEEGGLSWAWSTSLDRRTNENVSTISRI